MQVKAVKTSVFKGGGDLLAFIKKHVPKLREGSILAITSKIVALAEGRTAALKEQERVIRAESDWALQTRYGKITHKSGVLMWNAGTDASNANGKLILLPKDSFKAASELRRKLIQLYKVKLLGVVITDSCIMPLRAGVVGIALGYAGFKGLRDYRDTADIFGRKLKFTQTDVADSLATAATLAMGEGAERQPLAVITHAPVEFVERINKKELLVPFADDMYRPLFHLRPARGKVRKPLRKKRR